MIIEKAEKQDLKEILELQYIAYQSEAKLLNDWDIPPLRQTLDELSAEFEISAILKAVEDGRIIGSVRASEINGTVRIGKLFVSPDRRQKGIGKALLLAAESVYPHKRCELFTSLKSADNIRLYEKCGYKIFDKRSVGKIDLVYLEKRI